jgi:hypothetical protein
MSVVSSPLELWSTTGVIIAVTTWFDWLAPLLLSVAILLLLANYRAVRGLTLRGPWAWLLFALVLCASSELAIQSAADPSRGFVTALRFAAATALICPQISVLGAKRPQHQAWHAIVLSLWIVLTLPAAEGYFVRHSAALEVHDARGWFLWVLLLVGFANYLFTRHWAAAICYALGQVLLLAAHLPLLRRPPTPFDRNLACAAISLAVALVVLRRSTANRNSVSQLWTEFRDAYGAVWALRLLDRLNQTARICDWPVRLMWNGLEGLPGKDELTEKQTAAMHRALRTVLRRFVSPAWIANRLREPPS